MKLRFYLALTFLAQLFVFQANATHIVGGSITYEHLGGSTYRITQKLYKDCDPSAIGFPSNLFIDVYTGNGTAYNTITIPFPGQDTLDPSIDTCAFDPGVCVSQAIYTTIVNDLYPGAGGYHLVNAFCCRNGSIVNLSNPGGTGASYHAYIPDNAQVLTNSSPSWVNFPPVFICQSQPLNFDHSATDPDGDSLAYKLYTPFQSTGIAGWNAPPAGSIAPNYPQFTDVVYNANYAFDSPMEPSAPAQTLFIDNQTGIMTKQNPLLGQHVIGVMVEEWRDGQLLGIVYRDFQFNVLNCPPPALAGIGDVDACSGTSVQMVNSSTAAANDFEWDFGDGSPVDNSFEPTHTYAGFGSYNLQLIAQAGTNCADTTYKTINIDGTTASFTTIDSVCINSPVTFTDASSTAFTSVVNSWSWDFDDNGATSPLPNPTHTFSTGGIHSVQLVAESDVGCKDTMSIDVYIQGFNVADAGPDLNACINNPQVNLNGTIAFANGGLWIGDGGTFDDNTLLNAIYTPDTSEVNSGSSTLFFSSTGNGFCPAASDTLIVTYVPGPTADAGPDVSVCKDTSSIPLNGIVTIAGGGIWSTSGAGGFSPNNLDLGAEYIPTATDTANGSVQIFLTSINNGNCIATIDSVMINFFDPPTVDILATDTACTGKDILLDGNTSTGLGYWETLGSGTFSSDSSSVSSYIPSSADQANGSVTLVFATLNNGGCQQKFDTLDVNIIPSPTPVFSFTEVCFNEVHTFLDSSYSVDPITNIQWDFGDGSPLETGNNPSHAFTTEGVQMVSLIATSANGCIDTLTQPVNVHYLPNVMFVNSTPCLNGGSQFVDSTIVTNSSVVAWNWSFGDGNTSTDQNPLNVYANSGNYNVSLTATSAFGCSDSIAQSTLVLQGPSADFNASDYDVNLNESITFIDASSPQPLVSWAWDFDDGMGTDNQQNTTYSFDSTGTYNVMLAVEDANGCTDTTYKNIVVFMGPAVPLAFSPNGDNANDLFFVQGGPFIEMEFNIYNNWGELIFSTTDTNAGWDGTYNGVNQPLGVYVYTVKCKTEDNTTHQLSGDVTLLR